MRLGDFDVLTFDCYGTLIDWESGIAAALAPWLAREGVSADREAVLAAFGDAESAQEHETPDLIYSALLARVHGRLAAHFGVTSSAADAEAFGASVPDWPAFPDSATALADLKRHYKLVILSNVDRESFRGSNARLGVAFDAVFTAQDIGSYKPDPRNFDYLLAQLAEMGHPKERILHTAQSLYHDHVPAKRAGLTTAWIDRRAGRGGGATKRPPEQVTPDFRFTSLAEMAAAVEKEGAR